VKGEGVLVSVSDVRALLIDLDGTLYDSGAPVPGAGEALAALRAAGLELRFLTNTDSKPAAALRRAVERYGFQVADAELFTPVVAAERYLTAWPHARALRLTDAAIRPAGAVDPAEGTATHVVVGDCRDTLNYHVLDRAFRELRNGAELLALQRGRYFRSPDGEHLDTGAVVAALEYASGVTARVLGKPSPDFFSLAVAACGYDARSCAVVGDDATTDVAGGQAIGAVTVQVRTGKYSAQQREAAYNGTPLPRADHTIASIAELPSLLGL
jgi:HAD superfamily hydrolase (TIGR01458 family)